MKEKNLESSINMANKNDNPSKSIIEKLDEITPKEVKIFKEMALRRNAIKMLDHSFIGQITNVICLIIGLLSIFVYWRHFSFNIIISIILGFMTWLFSLYILYKILIKLLGIKRILIESNKKAIEAALKKLADTSGISTDEFVNSLRTTVEKSKKETNIPGNKLKNNNDHP